VSLAINENSQRGRRELEGGARLEAARPSELSCRRKRRKEEKRRGRWAVYIDFLGSCHMRIVVQVADGGLLDSGNW
jgi:hypothetical protein